MVQRDNSGRMAGGRRCRWVVASFAALLIVGAQLLALAHSHTRPGPELNSPAQASVDSICGLCVLEFLAPLHLATTIAVERPRLVAMEPRPAAVQHFASGSHSFFLTRAPPSRA
jgi:hypothetical protein